MSRYYPVSHELNSDAEVWELTDKFGDRSLRIWLEILRIMDAEKNHWKLVKGWDSVIGRKVRQQPATVRRAVGWMLARGWLSVRQVSASGSPEVYGLRNYAKFRKIAAERCLSPNLSETSELSEGSKPASPTPVDKSPEPTKKNSQIEEVFRVAKAIAGTDTARGRELCTFVAKTVKEGTAFGDSEEVINEAILWTLNQLKNKAAREGHPIEKILLWPYLQKTYKFKRTKALETESDRYKREPLQQAGSILNHLMAK